LEIAAPTIDPLVETFRGVQPLGYIPEMDETEFDQFGAPTGILPARKAISSTRFGGRRRRQIPLWLKCAGAVAVCCAALCFAWVRYQLDWIRQRHEFLADSALDLRKGRLFIMMGSEPLADKGVLLPPTLPPWSLCLFGETGVRDIWKTIRPPSWPGDPERSADDQWVKQTKSLFPEARVQIGSPYPHGFF
jgi:hypothetical protein